MTAFWLSVARSGKARLWESVDTGGVLQKNRDNRAQSLRLFYKK
jgi:hypothetical protein